MEAAGLKKLDDIAAAGDKAVLLCATHRLAWNLRLAHGRAQRQAGLARWHALSAATISQWLDRIIAAALLRGEVEAALMPQRVLGALHERILWERAIRAGSRGDPAQALFDVDGMATTAAEANRLMQVWNIVPSTAEMTEETRQFLRWRTEFRRLCEEAGGMEAVRHLDWQIECLARGAGVVPDTVVFTGFDRYNPQEERLRRVLHQRGVQVQEWSCNAMAGSTAVQTAQPDRAAECRAAAAWARDRLAQNPQARLGILTPALGAVREALAAALDQALDPQTLRSAHAETPRRWRFSIGQPLSRIELVSVAVDLLRLAIQARRVAQDAFGVLLRSPYWSAGDSEADARARLDALQRETLGPTTTLERCLRLARKAEEKNILPPRLLAHLEALLKEAARQPSRQSPSAWADAFRSLLAAAGWPGERVLSADESQAVSDFEEVLREMAQLDPLLGKVGAADALRRLIQLCGEALFQPHEAGDPAVLVMGMLEAAGAPFDGLWVMGMNDHQWPPPARPNPLLPAVAQRSAGAPGASAEVQAAFARDLHAGLLSSAPEVVFSWANNEGDRILRPSPLIAGLPIAEMQPPATLLQTLAASPAALETLADTQAPPVGEGEKVRGGTGLLRAQAICPAWAYYRYRLGAKKLETPVEGLDAKKRGSLVHLVLQHFWQGRASAEVWAMPAESQEAALAAAVEAALSEFNREQETPLPPRASLLERERLIRLVAGWLQLEMRREIPFRVVACEQRRLVTIEGISVNLILDRMDELEDGSRVILDYKTGEAKHNSWADERITEPQLPIYAALAEEPVSAVAFARVLLDKPVFVGIAAVGRLLPGVAGIDEDKARKLFGEQDFPDWDAVLRHWRDAVAEIAREIRAGEASVRFADENDLKYCEVLPLLRLAEHREQMWK